MAETTNAEKKKITVILGREIYNLIEKAAESRHRSITGEAGMALTAMYGEDPYLMDRVSGIALSQGINPATFIKRLVDEYEYQRLSKERSQ